MEPQRDEYELARRARDGDREALAELVERSRMKLFGLAYAELWQYEDAEDAVASGLLQVCRHIGELREPERVRPWMQSIVRNEARMRRRKQVPGTVGTLLDEAEAPADTAGPSLLRIDIERALRRLPREEARAVALFYMGSLSVHEIARRVDRPEGTIKRWLHLGRRHLAIELEGYAPMTPTLTAAIISTDLDPTLMSGLAQAVREAGFREMTPLAAIPSLDRMGGGESVEFHLPKPLRGRRLVILDEWIGGRSAFELYTILKAAAESKETSFCLLLSSPSDSTVFAAWAAGFDLCFTKEGFDPTEFQRCLVGCLVQEGSGA